MDDQLDQTTERRYKSPSPEWFDNLSKFGRENIERELWKGYLDGPEVPHLLGLGVRNSEDYDTIVARRRNL